MSNENVGNPDVLNFPRDTTMLRIAMASEERNRILREHYGLDPLSQMDGTKNKYVKLFKKFIDSNKGGPLSLTAICDDWYNLTRAGWHGWTDFLYTGVSAGTRGGDNENKTCVPSTNTVAGQDDFAGNPLFACLDCVWAKNPTTLEPEIVAICGITDGFERYNAEKFVGVLQQTGWFYQTEGAESWRFGYCSDFIDSVKSQPLPEAVRLDGSVRPWVVHAKYLGHVENGKWTCRAGVIPTAFISHNSEHTIGAATGPGISGWCYCDIDFLRKMMMIKYASLTLDGILQGCLNNNKTAKCAVSETGVKRLLLPSNAAAFEEGMGVFVGAINASGTEISRSATNYNISGSGGCIITAVETVTVEGTDYKAVYVDTPETFNTVSGETCICTFAWPTGSTDKVLGSDGSPGDPTTGVYPAKLQGIEYSVGVNIIPADTIMEYTLEGSTYYAQLYMVDRTANQSTSVTNNYEPSGVKLEQPPASAWKYTKHMKLNTRGVFITSDYGGTSSTYFKDGFYICGETVGEREGLFGGNLNDGAAIGGLSMMYFNYGLGHAPWNTSGGPSPNGDRGEWAA